MGAMPLATSPNNVAAAANLPPTLSTLVVPGLREPLVRGSGSPNIRQIKMAEEIDPSK